ncbi:hypothetical protein [Paraconexibacter sp.]|uniref:hypothetical protein n=1 Tax=Paraconexibacter sp. TaxID=2949640 RepID=UPI0035673D5E
MRDRASQPTQQQPPTYSADEIALARAGKLRLRTWNIADVLAEIGPPAGPRSGVGTVALQDVRDDRV